MHAITDENVLCNIFRVRYVERKRDEEIKKSVNDGNCNICNDDNDDFYC